MKKVTRMEKQNTDWFKILARNAVSQNYSLSLSGGNDKLNFTVPWVSTNH